MNLTPTRPIRRILGRAVLAMLLGVGAGAAESTNAPANAPRKADYASFKIIAERNIFSPKRSGRQISGPRETRRPARVDTFALVGTMSYDKGQFAFFDGSSSEFRQTLQRDGSIAGFKVVAIDGTSAKLEAKGKVLELRVGAQARREEGGEWQVSARRDSLASSSSSGSASDAGGSGGSAGSSGGDGSGAMSEVLKRLMEQREKENK